MDFDDLEEKAANPRTRMLILCNPHNPVGRVWKREELQRVAEICIKHQVLIIADEIHSDIVYPGHQYIPFASLSEEAAQQSFSCISPAKTFNIASVTDAMIVIGNEQYREQYKNFVGRYLFHKNNAFSAIAMEEAYSNGGEWLDELLIYLQANLDYLENYLKENIPKVKLIKTEGTFLAWLDFRELGIETKALEKFIAQEARIAINPGYWFGRQGAGFARMTIACPRSMLKEGLSRLEKAINGLEGNG
jgi:cystathionine beta-lyase